MLLGAAMALKRQEQKLVDLGGSVRLLFQPAEEGGGGALRMIEQGALNGADAAAMLHSSPELEVGTIASRAGAIMAGSTKLEISVQGVGGHAAYPHTTTDTVAAAAAVINGLHGIVSRSVRPTDSAVVSLTFLNAGHAYNVLPDEVTIGGTVRALDAGTLGEVLAKIRARAELISRGYGCTAVVNFREDEVFTNSRGVEWHGISYPPVVNDAGVFRLGMRTAEALFGARSVLALDEPSMAGEDFSFIGNAVPASMFWIGHRSEGHERGERTGNNLHNARFELDERVLPRGAAFLAGVAVDWIRAWKEKGGPADADADADAAGEL